MRKLILLVWWLSVIIVSHASPIKLEFDYDYEDDSDTNYSYYDDRGSIVGTLKNYAVKCKENSVQIDLDFRENFSGYVYPRGMLTTCIIFKGNGTLHATIDIGENHCGYDAFLNASTTQNLVIQWDPVLIQDYDVEIPISCQGYDRFSNVTPQAALILLKENVTLVSWKDWEPTSVHLFPHETVFVYVVVKSASPFNCAVIRDCYAQSKGEDGEFKNVLHLIDNDCSLYGGVISDIVSMSTASAVNSAVKTGLLKVEQLALTNSTLLRCNVEVIYSSCLENQPVCGSGNITSPDSHKMSVIVEASSYLYF